MATSNFTAAFNVLKGNNWPKAAGSKVTEAQLAAAATLVKRHGTGKHLGLAMTLRAEGATQLQVSHATGDTQLNVVRDVLAAKLAKRVTMPAEGRREVYKLELTAKGAAKAEPKAPRKAKATKAAAEVTDNGGNGDGNAPVEA